MDPIVSQLAEPLRHDGPRQFASWNEGAFLNWVAGPGERLWQALQNEPLERRRGTMAAFLRLLQEGIGLGYLGDCGTRPRGLLDAVVRERLPEWLAATNPDRRTELLAEVWNVSEGVAREAGWLDQYLLARSDRLNDPARFAQQLAELLEPVLSAPTSADWNGPLHVSVFDTRPVEDGFLPGPMQFIAPVLLCVRDRRRDVNFGLLLQRHGKSESVGPLGEAANYESPRDVPMPVWEQHRARIGATHVDLPFWQEPHEHAISAAGFLVVSTPNSQRLWIVETPA